MTCTDVSTQRWSYFTYLFIYSSVHINNKKIKTFNVHISAVWTKWPTQGQATFVTPWHHNSDCTRHVSVGKSPVLEIWTFSENLGLELRPFSLRYDLIRRQPIQFLVGSQDAGFQTVIESWVDLWLTWWFYSRLYGLVSHVSLLLLFSFRLLVYVTFWWLSGCVCLFCRCPLLSVIVTNERVHYSLATRWSGVVVSTLALINEVNLHRTRLVLRWVIVSGSIPGAGHLISVCNQPATQGQLSLPSFRGR